MKSGYEKAGMSAQEEEFYTMAEEISAKLSRIIELLERQGAVRPG
jgi:predicted deacetylase